MQEVSAADDVDKLSSGDKCMRRISCARSFGRSSVSRDFEIYSSHSHTEATHPLTTTTGSFPNLPHLNVSGSQYRPAAANTKACCTLSQLLPELRQRQQGVKLSPGHAPYATILIEAGSSNGKEAQGGILCSRGTIKLVFITA